MRPRRLLLAAGIIGGILIAADAVHAAAARRGFADAPTDPPMLEAVVVLGYRNRSARANLVNRYRVRAGLRSFDPRAKDHVLVLCGGGVAGPVPEATLMARYARARGFAGSLRIEDQSTSTWENIRNAIALIEHADAIKIVSNSLHAERARGYLRRQRPDLAARLRPAEDHRFGEVLPVKVVAVILELLALVRKSPRRGE